MDESESRDRCIVEYRALMSCIEEIDFDESMIEFKEHLYSNTLIYTAIRRYGINTVGGANRTPLLVTIRMSKPVIVEKLLKLGANLCAKDRNGWGVLHYSTMFCDMHLLPLMLKTLMNYPVDRKAKDKSGKTAVQYVASRDSRVPDGKIEAIEMLRAEPEVVNLRSHSHTAVLVEAVDKGRKEIIVAKLFQLVYINKYQNRFRHYLHRTVVWFNPFVARMLMMKHDFDPNELNDEGNSALHVLCKEMNQDRILDLCTLRVLLDYGARLDLLNAAGKTPLQVMETASASILIHYLTDAIYMILKHFAVLSAHHRPIRHRDMRMIYSVDLMRRFYREAIIELLQLKGIVVLGDVTYFQILIEPISRLVLRLEDEEFYSLFSSGDRNVFEYVVRNFPLYGPEFNIRFQLANHRLVILMRMRQTIREGMSDFFPEHLIKHISYLLFLELDTSHAFCSEEPIDICRDD